MMRQILTFWLPFQPLNICAEYLQKRIFKKQYVFIDRGESEDEDDDEEDDDDEDEDHHYGAELDQDEDEEYDVIIRGKKMRRWC